MSNRRLVPRRGGELFDLETKSNTPMSTVTDFKPRVGLRDAFEGPCQQRIPGLIWMANITKFHISNVEREVGERTHNVAP